MFLLLDNYDSFVHNLARYFRRLRCETQVIRSDEVDVEGCRRLQPEAVVISPGPRRPEEAGCSVQVVRTLGRSVPILGVCLGHQVIGHALGANIVTCGPMHGMTSEITHDATGLFDGCPSPMKVGRYHSLVIESSSVPDELAVTARTLDGIVMAVRHRDWPIFGIQFHPESVLTDQGMRVLENFVSIVHQSSDRLAT